MLAAEAEATNNDWPMVIAILDSGGNLVMLHRLDHANCGAIELAPRKAETAIKFRRPTKTLEDLLCADAKGLRMLSMASELIAVEGGERKRAAALSSRGSISFCGERRV